MGPVAWVMNNIGLTGSILGEDAPKELLHLKTITHFRGLSDKIQIRLVFFSLGRIWAVHDISHHINDLGY